MPKSCHRPLGSCLIPRKGDVTHCYDVFQHPGNFSLRNKVAGGRQAQRLCSCKAVRAGLDCTQTPGVRAHTLSSSPDGPLSCCSNVFPISATLARTSSFQANKVATLLSCTAGRWQSGTGGTTAGAVEPAAAATVSRLLDWHGGRHRFLAKAAAVTA